jgi:hypothetical protein
MGAMRLLSGPEGVDYRASKREFRVTKRRLGRRKGSEKKSERLQHLRACDGHEGNASYLPHRRDRFASHFPFTHPTSPYPFDITHNGLLCQAGSGAAEGGREGLPQGFRPISRQLTFPLFPYRTLIARTILLSHSAILVLVHNSHYHSPTSFTKTEVYVTPV